MSVKSLISITRDGVGRFISWLAPWAKPAGGFDQSVSAAALVVGFTLVLAIGPELQRYLVGILHASAPTIYGTAYDDSLIKFPSLSDWIHSSITSGHLWLTAAIVTLSALRRTRAREIFVSAALTSFIVLSLVDLGLGLIDRRITIQFVFTNAIANFVGGVLLGGVLVGLLKLTRLTWSWLSYSDRARMLFSSAAVISSGFGALLVAFYMAQFFYAPVPVAVDMTIAAPSSFSATPGEASRMAADNRSPHFAPIPRNVGGSPIVWTIAEGGLNSKWHVGKDSPAAEVELRFFAGCSTVDELRGVFNEAAPMKLRADRHVVLELDSGASELILPAGSLDTSEVTVTTQSPWIVHLGSADEKPHAKVTLFAPIGSALEIQSESAESIFFMTAYLLRFPDRHSKTSVSPRTLKVRVAEDQEVRVRLHPPKDRRSQRRVECSPIVALPAWQPIVDIQSDQLVVGISATISRPVGSIEDLPLAASTLRFDGGGGWIDASDLDRDGLMYATPSPVTFLQTRGNAELLEIDGQTRASHPLDVWTLRGDIGLSYDQSGRIRAQGVVSEAWRNQGRVNRTRWERLTWEWRTLLLSVASAIGFGMMGLARVVWRSLEKNERLSLPGRLRKAVPSIADKSRE